MSIMTDLERIFRTLTDGEFRAVIALVEKEQNNRIWFIDFTPPGLTPDLKEPINRMLEARNVKDYAEADRIKAEVMKDKRVKTIKFMPRGQGGGALNICEVQIREIAAKRHYRAQLRGEATA